MWGQKHQATIGKATTHQPQLQKRILCLPTTIYICVVLQSSIRHIDVWNCPKVMHKSIYTLLLVNDFARIA